MRIISAILLILISSPAFTQGMSEQKTFADHGLSLEQSVRQLTDPGQQLFIMDVRRRSKQHQFTPTDAATATLMRELWLSKPQIRMPNGRLAVAPVFDPEIAKYLGPYGDPVDMRELFKDQGAILPNLSAEERKVFDELLERYDVLTRDEHVQFRHLFDKGTLIPDIGTPTQPPFSSRIVNHPPPPRIYISNTCSNGDPLPPLCLHAVGYKLPSYCKCD